MVTRGLCRRILAAAAVVGSLLVTASSTPIVHAASTTPATGGWSWCTETVTNGCIEAVTTVSPTGETQTYTSSASLPEGLQVSAMCSPNGQATSCDGNKYETTTAGTCAIRPGWVGGVTTPSVEIDLTWAGKSGWTVVMRLSTGDFRPAFLIGHGTTRTQTTSDGDGTYTFEFTSMMEFAYSGPMGPSLMGGAPQSSSESIATTGRESVHVQLWPRDHLVDSPTTPEPCRHHPFSGAWAEANAQGFSWSYMTNPDLAGRSVGLSNVPNTLKFTAYAPHYKPQVAGAPLEVIDARVQVFLPTSYFRALGYATLDEFSASSYSVTTADGQTTTPSLTKRDDGVLINLGIKHYSAPNPTVKFAINGDPLPYEDVFGTTTPVSNKNSTGSSVASSKRPARPSGVSVKVRQRKMTVSLTAKTGVSYSAVATKGKLKKTLRCKKASRKVTCSVSSLTRGTWTVKVTPRNSAGAGTAYSKKVRVT